MQNFGESIRKEKPLRTIALKTGGREIGYAVLEGSQLLLFGVRRLKGRGAREMGVHLRRFVEQLAIGFRATVLVGERRLGRDRRRRPSSFERELRDSARSLKARVRLLPVALVKQTLTGDPNASTRQVAETIVESYPYLSRYLRIDVRTRKWYWYKMFEAVSLGITAHEQRSKERVMRALRAVGGVHKGA